MLNLDIQERNKIFSALDKYGGQYDNVFRQIIFDKCNLPFNQNKIMLDETTKEKLQFNTDIATLEYDENYLTCVLYDGSSSHKIIEENGDEEIVKNKSLSASNFIYLYEYNANPQKIVNVIKDMVDYYDIENEDKLIEILKNENISDETIFKLIQSEEFSQNPSITTEDLHKMYGGFLHAKEDEVKNLMSKIQRSIEPKFLVIQLYTNELIDEQEYYRLIDELEANELEDIEEFHVFLKPSSMLSLGAIDNVFKLVKDDKVGYKLTETFQTFGDVKPLEISYLDLLEKFPYENIYKQKLIEFLMNTSKSPYEIMLSTINADTSSSNASNSSFSTNDKQEDEKIEHFSLETQLDDSQKDLFDSAVFYVLHRGNPHYFSYLKQLEKQQEYHASVYNQTFVDENSSLDKGVKKYIKSKLNPLAKYPLKQFDDRYYLYENAHKHQTRIRENKYKKLRYDKKLKKDYLHSLKTSRRLRAENTCVYLGSKAKNLFQIGKQIGKQIIQNIIKPTNENHDTITPKA